MEPAPVRETIAMLRCYCGRRLGNMHPSASIWEELTRSGRAWRFEADLRRLGATPWQIYLIARVARTHPSSLELFESRIWREVEKNALVAFSTLIAWRRLGRICAENTSASRDAMSFFLRYPRVLRTLGAEAELVEPLAKLFAGRGLTWAEVEGAMKAALRQIEDALSPPIVCKQHSTPNNQPAT